MQNDIAWDTLKRRRINPFVLKMVCKERQMKSKNHHFKTIIMRYTMIWCIISNQDQAEIHWLTGCEPYTSVFNQLSPGKKWVEPKKRYLQPQDISSLLFLTLEVPWAKKCNALRPCLRCLYIRITGSLSLWALKQSWQDWLFIFTSSCVCQPAMRLAGDPQEANCSHICWVETGTSPCSVRPFCYSCYIMLVLMVNTEMSLCLDVC